MIDRGALERAIADLAALNSEHATEGLFAALQREGLDPLDLWELAHTRLGSYIRAPSEAMVFLLAVLVTTRAIRDAAPPPRGQEDQR